jgi:hypothetical protein
MKLTIINLKFNKKKITNDKFIMINFINLNLFQIIPIFNLYIL